MRSAILFSFAVVCSVSCLADTFIVDPSGNGDAVYVSDINLLAYWKLDGDATDSSGNGFDGTVYGNPSWVAEGMDGVSILLDGVDDHVNIPGYTGISGGASRTCSAWIKPTATELGLIVSWGSSAAGQKWTFRIESDGSLGVGVWGGYIKTTTQFVNDGNWHHVAAVLADDGSPDVSEIQLYIDGVLETSPYISNSQAIATTDSQNVIIGALLDTDSISYKGHFEGLIDDVRIYDTALNAEEIVEIMGPSLDVSSNTFLFTAYEAGSNPDAQLLTIENPGGERLDWLMDLADKPDWLTITPTTGSLDSLESEMVVLSVDIAGLLDGRYSYSFQVDSVNAFGNFQQMITVDLKFVNIWVPADYPTIQAAIDAAIEGDIIGVSPGTYFENITLKNGVALIGAGDNTIIDGNQHGSVVTSSNCDSSTLLEGFMIINGDASEWAGGGMYNYFSNPTVKNCTFSDNTVSYGGGMYNYSSNPTVKNCTFSDNTAFRGGGGMYNFFSNPTVKNCTFSDNAASDGGGMYNTSSSPTISHCTFSNNTASRGGGMSYVDGRGSVTITYCTFDGNQAYYTGGGVYSAGNVLLTVSNCKFIYNVAEDSSLPSPNYEPTTGSGGGLYLGYSDSCEMVNCTLTGNRAFEAGGGLWISDQEVALTNCILWDNTADSGDEIYNYYESNLQDSYLPVISHCDIAGCGGSGAGWDASMGIDGGGNIDADPLFEGANGAIQLDGLDDYVEIPGYMGIGGGDSRTCSAWIKPTTGEWGIIKSGQIVSWGSSAVGQKWTFRTESDGSLGVGVWGGYIKTTTQFVNDGNWHHVAAVLADDGSPDVSEIQLYIDGVLETSPFISNSQAILTGDNQNVVIGALLNADGSNYASHFLGSISDVRIYSRALNPSEIQQVMNDDLPATDLEAHWQLDGNAGDVSDNGRHGALYGGPVWATERSVDGAVQMDGVDDYIEIPDYKGITGMQSRTCSMWFKTVTPSFRLIGWGTTGHPGAKWEILLNEDGVLRTQVNGGYVSGVTNLTDGDWHHVAVVLEDDGSPDISEVVLYVDGQLEPIGAILAHRVDTALSENVKIGVDITNTEFIRGKIDEVSLYSRALSASEIQRVMNDDLPTIDLEAHWQLDGNVDDLSGNERHGLLYGGPLWITEDPIDVLYLDGLDDYVEIPGYMGISGGASRTCSTWIKTLTPSFRLIGWGITGHPGAKWEILLNEDGVLRAQVNGGYVSGVTDLTDGQWHHVAVVLEDDGSPDISEAVLYVDGQLESVGSALAHPVGTAVSENVKLGVDITGSGFIVGKVDDVSLYSRALSASEIVDVINNGSVGTTSLEAHWKLDGNVDDASGNERHGVLYGGPVWTRERFMEDPVDVLYLDGLDDFVEIPGYTGIGGGASRTCSAWIKPTTTEAGLIVSWGSSAVGQKWTFRTESDGSLGVGVWGGYIKTTNYGDIWQFVNDGNWHHVAAVLVDDGSPDVSEIQLYVDGVLEMNPYISNSQAIATTDGQNVIIGAVLDTNGISYTGHFEGRLRDVRIYNRALSQFEIRQMMDNENALTTNLEAHWKLDGNTDDASGNNRDGILYGEPVWAIDRFVDGEDNLRLKPCSPCIDAGDKEALPEDILTDLDGNPRILDGQVDMGCYEFLSPIEVDAKITPQVLDRESNRPAVIGRLEFTGEAMPVLDPDEPMVLLAGQALIEDQRQMLTYSKKEDAWYLVGFFDNAAVMEAIVEDGDVEVTIAAKLLTGQWVYGMDVVKIK